MRSTPRWACSRTCPLGAEVGPDAPLARVHARNADEAEAAGERLRAAYRLAEEPCRLPPADPVIERVAGGPSAFSSPFPTGTRGPG